MKRPGTALHSMRTGPDGLRPASSAAHRSLQRRLGAFNSTRVGLITIGVSASLIYAIYFFLAPTTSKDYVVSRAENKDSSGAPNILQVHPFDPPSNMDIINAENNVFKSAQLLGQPISDNTLKLVDDVVIEEKRVSTADLKIFYREARPPGNNFAKAEILMLHGQAFTSANWLEKRTLQTFAAGGYRTIAIDLPGYGQTAGKTVPNELKPEMLKQLIEELGLDRPVLVSPSMSGAYAMPFFMEWPDLIRAFIAIAPVNSGDYSADDYGKNKLPTLIVYGERDTSLGVSSASNMKVLPNGRVVKIPSAGHACYLNNPEVFHTACLNFLDLVRTHGGR